MTEAIKGLKELQEKLLELQGVAGLKVLASVSRKAMKPVLEDARRLVPVRYGLLKQSIRLATVKPDSGNVVLSSGIAVTRNKLQREIPVIVEGEQVDTDITEAKGAGWRYHFIEFGVPAHGIAAHPFLRPAFVNNASKMLEVVKAELAKRVNAIAKKAAKKAAK